MSTATITRLKLTIPKLTLLTLLLLPEKAYGIVNPYQQTANSVIYKRRRNDLGPTVWRAGVQCLDTFSELFLQSHFRYTRAYNMVLSSAANMSTPAAQIQDGFLKLVNEAVGEPNVPRRLFQLRVVSDSHEYLAYRMENAELLLADCYIIVVDSVLLFRNLMRDYVSHMRSWNPGARFLVLFNHAEQRDRGQQIAEMIFAEMQNEYFVSRVAVLFATAMTTYSFWIVDYFNSKACRTIAARLMGECRDGLAYPDLRTVNYSLISHFWKFKPQNCTFNMCTTISAPFVEADCDTGIEMLMMDVIKNRLRFSVNHSCSGEARGILDENGTWTGLLGRLNDRYCDFILGGFFPDNDVLEDFWGSECYLANSYTWYVKLADPRPPWMALYSIFDNQTWLCFVVMLLITWIFWFFVMNVVPEPEDFKEFSLAGINALAVTLCGSINERPLCNASRVFFLALTLYGMNAYTIYTSNLISVFTNPGYQHQISSLEEVAAAGIPFGGSAEYRDWFQNDDDKWIWQQYNDSSLFEPSWINLAAVKRGKRAILSSRMYCLQNSISDDIFAFSGNTFASPLQMIVKPGFPFLTEINREVRWMRESGFFSKILRDFEFNYTVLNRIAKMRPNLQEDVVVLTTAHLEGSFAILMVGTLCSTASFIGELMLFWCLAPLVKYYFGLNLDTNREFRDENKIKRSDITSKRSNERFLNGKRENMKQFGNKPNEGDVVPTYKVNAMQSVRFTPVKRRIVFSKKIH